MVGMRPINTLKLFEGEAIAKNASVTSVPIDLRQISQEGMFSVMYTLVGSGTLKLEYLLASEKNGTYVEPSGATDILTGGAVGTDLKTFDPELAPFMKIKATEENVDTITSLDLFINVQ